MRLVLAGLVAALAGGPAVACINDVELPTHEREFRSQYDRPAPPPVPPAAESAAPGDPSAYGLGAGLAGLILLAGAAALAYQGPAARG
jgi:hypothetical protein